MYTHGGVVDDFRQAQTFTPTTSGFLHDVSFNAHRWIDTTADLRISITSVVGGQPADILDSALIPSHLFGTSSLSSSFLRSGAFSHTVTLPGKFPLEAGVAYALVFSSDSVEAKYQIYGDHSGYADGANLRFMDSPLYEEMSGSDLLFRVTANPVPEPHMGLLGGAFALLLIPRRTRAGQAAVISGK